VRAASHEPDPDDPVTAAGDGPGVVERLVHAVSMPIDDQPPWPRAPRLTVSRDRVPSLRDSRLTTA
jgi:hypothetical protein